MKQFKNILAGIIAFIIFVYSVLAVIIRKVNIQNSTVFDGLGRELREPPLWARFILTDEKVWAGTGWHIFDILFFLGAVILAIYLYD